MRIGIVLVVGLALALWHTPAEAQRSSDRRPNGGSASSLPTDFPGLFAAARRTIIGLTCPPRQGNGTLEVYTVRRDTADRYRLRYEGGRYVALAQGWIQTSQWGRPFTLLPDVDFRVTPRDDVESFALRSSEPFARDLDLLYRQVCLAEPRLRQHYLASFDTNRTNLGLFTAPGF